MRYADPRRCPDCGAGIDPATRPDRCPVCWLPLTGKAASELFTTFVRADAILDRLRAEREGAKAWASAGRQPTPLAVREPLPEQPALGERSAPVPPAPAPHRVRLTVPAVLLGLGGLCVLVAALIFLALAWGRLGVAGRTSVLVALTGVAGILTVAFAVKKLRTAAETLGVVALALLCFDLVGARTAGWLVAGDPPHFTVVAGAVVAAVGAAGVAALRRLGPTPVGVQVVAALAYLLAAAAGVAATPAHATAAAVVLLVSVVVGATVLRLALPVMSAGPALAALAAAAGLTGLGVARSLSANLQHTAGWSAAWPLVFVAVVASGVVSAARRGPWVRAWVYAASLLAVLFAGVVPHLHSVDAATLVACLVLLAGATATRVRLTVAAMTGQLVAAAAAGVAVVGGGVYVASLATALAAAAEAVGTWGTTADVPLPSPTAVVSPWTAVAVTATLAGAQLVSRVRRPGTDKATAAHTSTKELAWRWLLPVVAALVLTALGYRPPLWLACLLPLVAAGAAVALSRRGPRSLEEPALVGAVAIGVAALLSVASAAATAGVWTVGALGALLALRTERPSVRIGAASALPVIAGVAVAASGAVARLEAPWAAFAVVLVVAVLCLVAPRLAVDGAALRRPTQAASLVVFGVAVVVGTQHTDSGARLLWLAVLLSTAGAAADAVGVLDRDRLAAALGMTLLLAALWVRLADAGVSVPEAYTAPAALLLAGVGWFALRTRPDVRSYAALGPALAAALLPSLLFVVRAPLSARAFVLGLGCLALVSAGAALKWGAPLLYGAVAGAVVAMVELAPMGHSVPRWALIGGAGALLLGAGVAWERMLLLGRSTWALVASLR